MIESVNCCRINVRSIENAVKMYNAVNKLGDYWDISKKAPSGSCRSWVVHRNLERYWQASSINLKYEQQKDSIIIKRNEDYNHDKKEIIQILKKDLYFNGYYKDFLRCIKNHTFSNISEKNKTEMERKFIYAIKKALENLWYKHKRR